MDTPDTAAEMADSQVADAINKDWLLASARSSQLSTDLRHYDLNWSSESGNSRTSNNNYGTVALPVDSQSRQLQGANYGSASVPPPSESSWLVRHQFWPSQKDRGHTLQHEEPRASNYINKTYAINGHLYDNISYADSPLMRSITRKPHNETHYSHATCIKPPAYELNRNRRQFCGGKFRILLACFVLLGITLANYSRNALSLAAVGMIASNALNRELVDILANDKTVRMDANRTNRIHEALDGSCPLVDEREAKVGNSYNNFLIGDNSISAGPLVFDSIQMSASSSQELAHGSAKRKDDLESQFKASIKRRVENGQLVDWSPSELGLISAAGSVGNLLIAIPLTRMGEIYGPKWIIFVASLGATIQAAFMPVVSTNCNVLLVIVFQIIFNGLTYGADCVTYTLFAHWLTPTEMAFFVSCLIICYQLGTMMSSFVTAKILALALDWCWCFYTPAILCGVWTIIWSLIGASEPRYSRLIAPSELGYLTRSSKIAQTLSQTDSTTANTSDQHKRSVSSCSGSHPVSWGKLARDPNIWAVIAVKFTLRWYFSAYSSLMPTYLSSVAHMSVETIGTMSVAQSFMGLFCGILMGYLTKSLVTRRPFNLSLASTRKCCQSIVNFGLALSLLVFISYDCNQWVTISALTVSGFCICFYVAAALQIPLDMSPTHCGLITSITNTLALGQALGAPVSGLILNDGPKERSRWRIVWALAIVMNALSGLVFILLVDAKPRDYNKYSADERVSRRQAEEASCSHAGLAISARGN